MKFPKPVATGWSEGRTEVIFNKKDIDAWLDSHMKELANAPTLSTSLPEWAIMATWVKERIEECL
jgi:hypothetical protein